MFLVRDNVSNGKVEGLHLIFTIGKKKNDVSWNEYFPGSIFHYLGVGFYSTCWLAKKCVIVPNNCCNVIVEVVCQSMLLGGYISFISSTYLCVCW